MSELGARFRRVRAESWRARRPQSRTSVRMTSVTVQYIDTVLPRTNNGSSAARSGRGDLRVFFFFLLGSVWRAASVASDKREVW
jgi:hypothetical protein